MQKIEILIFTEFLSMQKQYQVQVRIHLIAKYLKFEFLFRTVFVIKETKYKNKKRTKKQRMLKHLILTFGLKLYHSFTSHFAMTYFHLYCIRLSGNNVKQIIFEILVSVVHFIRIIFYSKIINIFIYFRILSMIIK